MARLFDRFDALEGPTAFTPPFTIGMLLRSATGTGSSEFFLIVTSSFQFRWQQYTVDGQLGVTFPGVADYFGTGVASPTASTWTWVAYSQITSTTARLRVGTSKYDFSTAAFSNATGFLLNSDGQGINAEIAELAYWPSALSDANAVDLAGLKFPTCVAGLTHYWPLNHVGFPEPDDVGSDDLTEYNGTTSIVTHPTMVSCGGGGVNKTRNVLLMGVR